MYTQAYLLAYKTIANNFQTKSRYYYEEAQFYKRNPEWVDSLSEYYNYSIMGKIYSEAARLYLFKLIDLQSNHRS